MIKLAIDAMGGDNAPSEIVKGVNLAVKEFDDVEFTLFGDEEQIKKYLVPSNRVKIVHAPEALSMGEKDPIRTIRTNKELSLVKAFQAVHDKECDGVVTAGPTQGVIVAAHMIIRRIPGMQRVALCPAMPVVGGKSRLVLDVGANTDIRPEHMLQHAQFASVYVSKTRGIEKPLVGLLNIGTEPGKGRELEKEAFALFEKCESINFYGNVEPKELFTTPCDIIITDGYSGNICIKSVEGTAKAVGIILKEEIGKSFASKIGYLFMRKTFKNFKYRMSGAEVGGALVFGVDGIVTKSHGSSEAMDFKFAIAQARKAVKGEVVEMMKTYLSLEEQNNE